MSKPKTNSPKKKKKGSLLLKLFLIFILILSFALAGLYVYMKHQTDPGRLLENYISTFMSKDTDALFHTLGFQKQDFITPELLNKSLEECHKYSTITSYGMTQEADSTTDSLHYHIKYWDNNRKNPYEQDLILKKTDTPLYFFFDEWKIDTSNFLARNCTISVPANADVQLDGVSFDKSAFSPAEKNTASFKIGDLFAGTHKLTVSLPEFDDYATSFFLAEGSYKKQPVYSVTTSMMTLSEKAVSKLKKDSETLIHSIYENALKEKSFNKLARKVNFEESSLETLKQAYNTLVTNNIKSPTHLTDVNFHKCTASSSPAYAEDGCYAINILTDIDYTSTSFVLKEEMNGGALRPKTVTSTKTGSSNSLFTTTFHLKDGKWSIYSTTALDACIYYTKY